MIRIEVTGLQNLTQALADMSQRRLSAALATGLTRTARAIGTTWQADLRTKLDRPTPFTLRAVNVQTATAASLAASVNFGRRPGAAASILPAEYIATQHTGGRRRIKKFEAALQAQGSMPAGTFVVPGKHAKLDAYGNLSRGQIVQILVQLGTAYSPGYQRVISQSAARRAASAIKRGRNYVAVLEQRGKLSPGVYQAQGDQLLPVLFYERRTSYRQRLDLIQTARQALPPIVAREFDRALAEQLTRLQAAR
jgi:hypothetical protein